MKKTVTGHMIVRNEERWIWYSIMSVIDFVDQMIIFDTGSIDKTVDIIKLILQNKEYKKKIIFEEKGEVTVKEFFLLRQEQIDRTTSDYFFVVDGDEIWYKNTLKNILNAINKGYDLIAIRFINCAGDIYHYRDFSRETYKIKDVMGSITIRVYSTNIKGIKCKGTYGVEGYYDYTDSPVQNSEWNIEIVEGYYLHMSMLPRSGIRKGDLLIKYRRKKYRADWDHKFDQQFIYPEVLYYKCPNIVVNPWKKKIGLIDYIFYILRKVKNIINI